MVEQQDGGKKLTKQLQGYLIPTTLIFVFLLISALVDKSLMQSFWPYIIMAGIALLFELLPRIKVPKITIGLVVISSLMILFGAQFWFYFVIPDYYDYQPIMNDRLGMIYQLHGKMQVFYSPDYPKQGDVINGYVSACSNDHSKCIDLENYTLNAFFKDESGTKHVLINNGQFNSKQRFEIDYMGEPIYVDMKYNNRDYLFILPKSSFWQTFRVQFNRHPIYGLISLVGTILGIITAFNLSKVKNLFTKIKNVYLKDINKAKKKIKPKRKKEK